MTTGRDDMSQTAAPEVDETVWEAAAEGVDVRVVRALRSAGVHVEHLGRAAKFLQVEQFDTVETLKRQAEYLREDLPSLFVAAAPEPDPASASATSGSAAGSSGVARGRQKARDLGWVRAKP
jgi:hypothetical protein